MVWLLAPPNFAVPRAVATARGCRRGDCAVAVLIAFAHIVPASLFLAGALALQEAAETASLWLFAAATTYGLLAAAAMAALSLFVSSLATSRGRSPEPAMPR